MSRLVRFAHGVWADDYEKQANEQGYTFGEEADRLQQIGYTLVFSHINRIITDSEYDRILRRFTKYLGEHMMEEKEDDE